MKNQYSKEFKLKALELVEERGSLVSVARELNIRPETLRKWKGGLHLGSGVVTIAQRSKEEEENIRLRRELNEIRLERDILKKAVSIFSKSDR